MQVPQRNLGQNMLYFLKLYGIYLKLYFHKLIEYRADTWITLFTGLLTQAGSLAFVGILFQRIPQLAGWSFYELMFIYAFSVTGKALAEVFLNASFDMNGLIRRGMLDVFLVRPAGPLFQAIGISQEINGMGMAITGIMILIFASFQLALTWTPGKVLYAIIAILSCMFVYFSVVFIVAISTFWLIEIRSFIYPVAWLFEFTRYPLEIFHPVLRVILIYAIPYAMGSFYPAAYLLRPEQYSWALWAVPVFTALLLWSVYQFWLQGLKRYSSVAG